MADVDKMIEEIYENLDSSTKKSKAKNDFIPEFKGKVQGAMTKSGIPFTNESFSEAISIIGKTVKENNGMTYDSIDSLVAVTFDNLSIKEIARLKGETTKTGADIAKEVAAAAIGVKVAESVANNALSKEQLQGLLDHMETISREEWGQIYDGFALLPVEDRAKVVQFKKNYYRNNALLTPEEQDKACDNMDLLGSNSVIEDLLNDDAFSEDSYSRMLKDLLDELKDFKMARAKVVTLKDKGLSDEQIYRELFEISKTIPKRRAEEYDAKAAGVKNFNELRFVDFGELSIESIVEVMGVSPKEAESFLRKYDQQRLLFASKNDEYVFEANFRKEDEKFFKEYDGYTGNFDLFSAIVNRVTRAEIDRSFLRTGDIEAASKALLDYDAEKAITLSAEAGETTIQNQQTSETQLEYNLDSIVKALGKDTDIKTIKEALKLVAKRTQKISKDAEQVELLGHGKRDAAKEWIEKAEQDIKSDDKISEEVKSIYIKIMRASLYDKRKTIFKTNESIAEYLEYISQEQLPELIKQGIEDKDKPKEENTPTQPQEATVPIGNTQMGVFMGIFGGPVNGSELTTVYLGGRESLLNKEKEKINRVNSMENYLGKVVEGGPITYDDIKDRYEKQGIIDELETAEPLQYNEPSVEAVNELLIGPRGKKLVKNPEEMMQEEVNPMEEVAQEEPKAPDNGETPKGPEEGVSAPEEPATINEPETQGVEDAFEAAPIGNEESGINDTIPEVEEPAEEVIQEEITQEDIGEMVQEVGETPEEPQFEEADLVEEAPVPAVISDRQGQLKKLSENVPMRAVREMMDHIKQKMIELKDRITGKNKNPEDRENNDDDFTQ